MCQAFGLWHVCREELLSVSQCSVRLGGKVGQRMLCSAGFHGVAGVKPGQACEADILGFRAWEYKPKSVRLWV